MKLFRHYKGGIYEVIGVATNAIYFFRERDTLKAFHTERETFININVVGNQMFASEHLVVYRDEKGNVWARPYDMFHDSLEYEGQVVKRFEKIT
jgi:hypothetical protein